MFNEAIILGYDLVFSAGIYCLKDGLRLLCQATSETAIATVQLEIYRKLP